MDNLQEVPGSVKHLLRLSRGALETFEVTQGISPVRRAPASDAEQLTVSYTPPTAAATTKAATDRWNFWVFRTRANANLRGEKSERFASLSSSQSGLFILSDTTYFASAASCICIAVFLGDAARATLPRTAMRAVL